MKSTRRDDRHYMSSVRAGPKGQIVIPKEAREMFGIEPGDMLVLLAEVALISNRDCLEILLQGIRKCLLQMAVPKLVKKEMEPALLAKRPFNIA